MTAEEPGESREPGQDRTDTQAGDVAEPRRKALHRTKHNNILAGVAGGLSDYFGIDVLLVRLSFFLLLIPGGVAIPLYLAAWILIPLEGERYSIGERLLDRARGSNDKDDDDAWVWIVVVVVGVLAIGSLLDRGGGGWFFWGGGSMFWSLALIAAGIWLYRQDQKESADASLSDAKTRPTASGSSASPPAERSAAVPREPEPKPRREPSRLGRYTFASMLVIVGLMAMVDNASAALDPTIGQYAAIAVGVVGVGLLMGSVRGRSRPLILLGVLLLPFTFIGFDLGLPVATGAGEGSHSPATVEDLDDYELFAGDLNVDLTAMAWDDQGRLPAETSLEVVFGQINVVVPSDVTVELDGRALAGQVSLVNRHNAGLNAHMQHVADGEDEGPRLTLDAEVLFGQINVERGSTPAMQVRP